MRRFNMQVPESVFGVDPEILRPIMCWPSHEEYKIQAKKLAVQFAENFKRYEDGVPEEVVRLGGPDLTF